MKLFFEIGEADLQQIAKYRPALEAYRAARYRDCGPAAANNLMLGKPFRHIAPSPQPPRQPDNRAWPDFD